MVNCLVSVCNGEHVSKVWRSICGKVLFTLLNCRWGSWKLKSISKRKQLEIADYFQQKQPFKFKIMLDSHYLLNLLFSVQKPMIHIWILGKSIWGQNKNMWSPNNKKILNIFVLHPLVIPDVSRYFEYLSQPAHLSIKPEFDLWATNLSIAVFSSVKPLKYTDYWLTYFLQLFSSNQLVRPETKHSIWQGTLQTPCYCVHLSVLVCVNEMAWKCVHFCLQRGDVSQIAASIHAPETVCPSA